MKLIDYIIIAAILGCCVLAYAGFRMEAGLLLIVVIIVASWRFWDKRRERDLMRGPAGRDNCPDHPDSMYSAGHESSHSSGESGGGDGGD